PTPKSPRSLFRPEQEYPPTMNRLDDSRVAYAKRRYCKFCNRPSRFLNAVTLVRRTFLAQLPGPHRPPLPSPPAPPFRRALPPPPPAGPQLLDCGPPSDGAAPATSATLKPMIPDAPLKTAPPHQNTN